jgi:hypothetical protein
LKVTDQMVDLLIREWATWETFVGCLLGRCKAVDKRERCPECTEFQQTAARMRVLTGARIWEVMGIGADEPDPPAYLIRKRSRAAWRRAWQLRLELIEAAAARQAARDDAS